MTSSEPKGGRKRAIDCRVSIKLSASRTKNVFDMDLFLHISLQKNVLLPPFVVSCIWRDNGRYCFCMANVLSSNTGKLTSQSKLHIRQICLHKSATLNFTFSVYINGIELCI